MMSSPALSLIFCDHDEQIDDKFSQVVQLKLAQGKPVVVIAGGERRRTLDARLRSAGFDPDELEQSGRLRSFEGCQILNHSCVDGRPDRARLREALAPALNRIESSTAPTLLVELSALLWKDGLHGAALELGGLLAELARTEAFELISVHSRDTFRSEYGQAPPLAVDSRVDDSGPDSRGSGRFEAVSPIESILIVEDDPDFSSSLRALLEHFGYRVIGIAHSAEQALEAASFDPPDLVIMDIGLSGALDGVDVMTLWRQRQPPGPAVVYLTGRSDEETLRRIRRTENHGLLLKPCQGAQLQAAVKLALDRRRSEQRALGIERSYAASAHESLQHLLAELHDQVGQPLVGVSILCRLLAQQAPEPLAATVQRIEELVNTATARLSHIMRDGYLAPVEDVQLTNRLTRLCADTRAVFGVDVSLELEPGVDERDTFRANELSLIAQEAVTNAVRHGQASAVHIALRCSGGAVSLSVDDNGVGRKASRSKSAGLGIGLMEYRSRLCGATLDIRSGDPSGTRVICCWRAPRA
jgi:signal transduction histidine kinase